MQIHQFVHTLNYGDAISGEAIALRRLLKERSIASEIYSVHAHEKVAAERLSWARFEDDVKRAGEEVVVLLHYSIASPLNSLFLQTKGITRALIYHNLTPAHWFERYNARVAKDLVRGRAELPTLLPSLDLALADSTYNADELRELGAAEANVLPLFVDRRKWSIQANPGIAAALRSHGGVNFLHVGRIAPNKKIEDIIKAFYFYHHKIEQKSRLWLIGSDIDTELYSFELRRLTSELRLSEAVQFVGSVSDDELKAFYESSDLYLCMSEHEGFCVPLLEAMHFGLPIIAYDACAVRETLGGAGILLGEKQPALTSELMQYMLTDRPLVQRMTELGRARAEELGEEAFAKRLEQTLLEPLARPRGADRTAAR